MASIYLHCRLLRFVQMCSHYQNKNFPLLEVICTCLVYLENIILSNKEKGTLLCFLENRFVTSGDFGFEWLDDLMVNQLVERIQ